VRHLWELKEPGQLGEPSHDEPTQKGVPEAQSSSQKESGDEEEGSDGTRKAATAAGSAREAAARTRQASSSKVEEQAHNGKPLVNRSWQGVFGEKSKTGISNLRNGDLDMCVSIS